jgi:hypothetical protein
MTQYKLMLESQVKLDPYILAAGHKAINYYKQRSHAIKGPQGVLHHRTVMMINYHLSELLKN